MVFGKYWMKNMKVSSKESKKQQMGLGSFHMRNYPAHIVLCLLSMLPTPIRSEKRIRVNQRIQLKVTLLSLFIHDNLLVENSVSSVKIHNPTLI